jgi:hypothetical protein
MSRPWKVKAALSACACRGANPTFTFIANFPLGRHTGEGRYPAMKKSPRSGHTHGVVPLAWISFIHMDSGLRRNDVVFCNGKSEFIDIAPQKRQTQSLCKMSDKNRS